MGLYTVIMGHTMAAMKMSQGILFNIQASMRDGNRILNYKNVSTVSEEVLFH